MRTPDDIARHSLRYEPDGQKVNIYARSDDGFILIGAIPQGPTTQKWIDRIRDGFAFVARRTYRDIAHSVLYHTKRHIKCAKVEKFWTHGPGTDIRKKDQACRYFEAKP